MFRKVKDVLNEDISLLIDILSDIGFHNIEEKHNRIECGLPDGDNTRSVTIKIPSLQVNVYTRNEFDNYEIQDIFTLISFVTGLSLKDSKNFLCKKTGVECDGEVIKTKHSRLNTVIRKFKKKQYKEPNYQILDESYISKYKQIVVKDWINEGISEETQKLFQVFIDEDYKRWKFPIRDEHGNLVTTKGRTYIKDFDLLGIGKYKYYPNIGVNSLLFNLHMAKEYIEKENEVIIFESEKSVMKAWGMGFKNCVAISNKKINPYLVRKILSLKCSNVVFALDKDVTIDGVEIECKKIKTFKNVFYIIDEEDLLGEKDSPVDKGLPVWLSLYSKRKRFI